MLRSTLLFCLFGIITAARSWAQSSEGVVDCVLQPFDLLKVQVYQEPELTIEVRVTQEYTITLPHLDKVDLKNKSLRQAEQMIRDLYNADYLVNPQVNLIVLEYAKRTINVLGAVTRPGAVLFPPNQKLTLVDAISLAGGFNRLADRKRVRLSRNLPDGKTENVVINADQVLDGTSTVRWDLQINDTIYVSERML